MCTREGEDGLDGGGLGDNGPLWSDGRILDPKELPCVPAQERDRTDIVGSCAAGRSEMEEVESRERVGAVVRRAERPRDARGKQEELL